MRAKCVSHKPSDDALCDCSNRERRNRASSCKNVQKELATSLDRQSCTKLGPEKNTCSDVGHDADTPDGIAGVEHHTQPCVYLNTAPFVFSGMHLNRFQMYLLRHFSKLFSAVEQILNGGKPTLGERKRAVSCHTFSCSLFPLQIQTAQFALVTLHSTPSRRLSVRP